MGYLGRRLASVERWLGRVHLATWIIGLCSIGAAIVIAYAASITDWLRPWGPIGYIGVSIIGLLTLYIVGSGSFFVYSSAKVRSALARYSDRQVQTLQINPLDNSFTKRRINLSDFFHPFGRPVGASTFQDCELFGPATIFLNGCRFLNSGIHNCDILILNDNVDSFTAIRFDACIFERCHFYRATMFVTKDQAVQLRRLIPEINIISGNTTGVPSSQPVISD